MEIKLNLNQILSICFICLATLVFSQDVIKENSVADLVYEEYKQNDINKALEKYRNLKEKNLKDYNFTEWELNRIGYQIMHNDGDMEAAGEVFKLNLEEYPEAANPHDSYADYLLAKGDKEAAKKHLEKAISMAEKNSREDEKDLMKMSMAKLAKLEDKHKQLDFLRGDWNVKSTSYAEGLGSGVYTGRDEYIQHEDENMIMINHMNQQGKVMGKRILVYDAVEDEYDVAYIDINAPMGIQTSSLKLMDMGNDTYELTEHYEEGNDKKMKHELKKNPDGSLNWVIFEFKADEKDWKKVYAMDMSKNKM